MTDLDLALDLTEEAASYRTLLRGTLRVAAVATILNMLIGLHWACTLFTGLGTIGCWLLTLREKRGLAEAVDRAALLGIQSSVLTGLYFFNGGLLSAVPYYFVLVNLSSIHLLAGKFLKLFAALQLLVFATLVSIEQRYPHLVVPYETELAQKLDCGLGVVLVLLFCSWSLREIQDMATVQRRRRVRAHAQLRTLVTHLEQTHRFTRHDLRGSLSSVESILELRDLGEFSNGEALDLVTGTVRDSLALLSNPQHVAARSPLNNPLETDFESIVANCIRRYRVVAQSKGQSVTYRTEGAALVLGDKLLLDSVVNNLLSNAVKYSPPDTCLDVELTSESGMVRLDVKDSGPGVAVDEVSRLFQPYAQLSAEPTGGEDSTGLGLFIVRSIAEQHGGSAEHIPQVSNRGSIFRITLPLWNHTKA